MKYFPKKSLGHEIFRSMVFWATNFFFEKFLKPSVSISYIHNVHSLRSFLVKLQVLKMNKITSIFQVFTKSLRNLVHDIWDDCFIWFSYNFRWFHSDWTYSCFKNRKIHNLQLNLSNSYYLPIIFISLDRV